MQQLPLESILQPGQEYVQAYVDRTKADIKAWQHDQATITCFEKAAITGLEPEQVIKSVVRYDKKGLFYIFVSPELGERGRPTKFDDQTIKRAFKYDKRKAKPLMGLQNGAFPVGMDEGTCTFLVPDNYFEGDGYTGRLEKIYIIDHPSIDDKIVDISIGGYGEKARKISLQGTYGTFYDLVSEQFPGKIEKIRF